jgi:hypothetical protein
MGGIIDEIKFRGRELFEALSCAIKSDYHNRIVGALSNHRIISYSGSGNMPQLIKSILNSKAMDRNS